MEHKYCTAFKSHSLSRIVVSYSSWVCRIVVFFFRFDYTVTHWLGSFLMSIYNAWDKSLSHRQIKLDLSKVLKENWGRMKFNGYENYAVRYYRVKHKKVSVVSFQRILHTKFISIDVTKKARPHFFNLHLPSTWTIFKLPVFFLFKRLMQNYCLIKCLICISFGWNI